MPPSTLELKISLLLEQMERLPHPERLLLQILALADEPLTPTSLLRICSEARLP